LENTFAENANIFKAFCDETRLMALSLLQNGEKCACELLEEVNVSQPTLSHHMKILVESGIVVSRKKGKWMYYSICPAGSEKAITLLKKLTELTVNQTESKKECCAWLKDVVPMLTTVVQKA
jgi:ArsR family transcriptional regulator